MKAPRTAHRGPVRSPQDETDLLHALRTHQVDAIVGEHHVMLVRLKQAEDDLQSSRNQLRMLAAHLLAARESERAAIARELHDEFGQALTSLQLGLSWLSLKVSPDQRPVLARIRSLSDTTTSLLQSVRSITSELRPGALDELGLTRTLALAAMTFQEHTGIRCRFETNTRRVAWDDAAAVALFRIVQAALTNVARHARASRVDVALMKDRTAVAITIQDNGRGIGRRLADDRRSLGISGMRERTIALDGTFSLTGARRTGTLLTARIPLSRAVAIGT